MKIDKSKRTLVQSIGLTGLGVTVAATVPGVFAAAQTDLARQIPSSGVTLTHYSNFQGRTVLLRNTTDRRLSLYKLSPQKIVTPDGEIDLEAMLESGALSIPANTTQALSISDTGKVERHASWTHLGAGIPVESVNTDIQSVTVTGKYDGMREISATSVHLATVTVS